MKFFKNEPIFSKINTIDYGTITDAKIIRPQDRFDLISFEIHIQNQDSSFTIWNYYWNSNSYEPCDGQNWIKTLFDILQESNSYKLDDLVGRKVKTYWQNSVIMGFRFYGWQDKQPLIDTFNKAKENFEEAKKNLDLLERELRRKGDKC